MIGDPSRLRLIREAAALVRIFPHFDFSIKENVHGESGSTMTPSLIVLTELLNLQKSCQFPDDPVRIEV